MLMASGIFLKHIDQSLSLSCWKTINGSPDPQVMVYFLSLLFQAPTVWSQLIFCTQLFLKGWLLYSFAYSILPTQDALSPILLCPLKSYSPTRLQINCHLLGKTFLISLLKVKTPLLPNSQRMFFLVFFFLFLFFSNSQRMLFIQQRTVFFLLYIIIKAKTVSDLGQMLST